MNRLEESRRPSWEAKEYNSKSHHYQFKYHEFPCDPFDLSILLESTEYIDANIKDQLNFELDKQRNRLLHLLKKHCTKNQWKVIKLLLDGKTQLETANLLGITQGSISQIIHGNIVRDLKNKTIKIYGGIENKMKKVAKTDKILLDIAENIRELV